MNRLALALTASLALAFAAPALAGSQQDRMKDCNAEAKTKALAGDARKAFMKTCLSGNAAATGNSQQKKMKDCNAEAKTKALAGEPRKSFMKECLSK
jgi:uncharacterized membrane protein